MNQSILVRLVAGANFYRIIEIFIETIFIAFSNFINIKNRWLKYKRNNSFLCFFDFDFGSRLTGNLHTYLLYL